MDWHRSLLCTEEHTFLKLKQFCLKRKRTIQNVIGRKFKSQHLGWYGGVLVLITWVFCTPVMLKSTYKFHNIFCYPGNVFYRDVLGYSSQSHILLPSMTWLWSAMWVKCFSFTLWDWSFSKLSKSLEPPFTNIQLLTSNKLCPWHCFNICFETKSHCRDWT